MFIVVKIIVLLMETMISLASELRAVVPCAVKESRCCSQSIIKLIISQLLIFTYIYRVGYQNKMCLKIVLKSYI